MTYRLPIAPTPKAEPMPTATQLRNAQALESLLDDFPPSLSDRDRRIRAVVRMAASALREGRPLSEVAQDAAEEVYGFCLLPEEGQG